jgi:hypothetical protein
MLNHEAMCTLDGRAKVDDAYLCGARTGRKVGLGSHNKVSLVAAATTRPRPEHHLRWAVDGCQSGGTLTLMRHGIVHRSGSSERIMRGRRSDWGSVMLPVELARKQSVTRTAHCRSRRAILALRCQHGG